MYSTLMVTEPQSGIKLLTLNRPSVLNAINSEMITELIAFYRSLSEDQSTRVVVITGAGHKAFCSGADLKVRNQMTSLELEAQHRTLEELNFIALESSTPVIAAVNGYAFGGGAEIALLADFIFASPDAVFGLPEAKVGLIPGFGGTQRMARRIGIGRAKELIFTSSRIDAQTAMQWGLVNRIFPKESLVEEVINIALSIKNNSPISIRESKQAVDKGYDLPLRDALNVEIDCYHRAMSSEDRIEGIKAFNEKREPNFKGK